MKFWPSVSPKVIKNVVNMGFLGWVGLITFIVTQTFTRENYEALTNHSKIDPNFGINEQIMANFDHLTSYNVG
jgi:hypothetical protein